MSDELYARDLLRLAASAAGAGKLVPHDAMGAARNPVCGDRVSVTLRLDPDRRILDIAHETQACVLTQASAAILGMHLQGADARAVERLQEDVRAMLQGSDAPQAPFGDYSALAGAAQHRNRHRCVLLPIEAVLDALGKRTAG
jgi:nitrogen fixation NifU-like protein